MPMTLQLSIRSNVPPATRRRIDADVALIADGVEFLTGHQVAHLRPPVIAMLARAAARQGASVEAVARLGGGL